MATLEERGTEMSEDHTTIKEHIARIDERVGHLEESKSSDRELLVRIDERTGVLAQSAEENRKHYVLQSEFEPVKRIVFGMVTLGLIAIVGALLSQVVIK